VEFPLLKVGRHAPERIDDNLVKFLLKALSVVLVHG